MKTCHSCKFYAGAGSHPACLISNANAEVEKLKNGLAGLCEDFAKFTSGRKIKR